MEIKAVLFRYPDLSPGLMFRENSNGSTCLVWINLGWLSSRFNSSKSGEADSIQHPTAVLALSFGVLQGHSKCTLHLECIPINLAFSFFFNRFCNSLGGKIYIEQNVLRNDLSLSIQHHMDTHLLLWLKCFFYCQSHWNFLNPASERKKHPSVRGGRPRAGVHLFYLTRRGKNAFLEASLVCRLS